MGQPKTVKITSKNVLEGYKSQSAANITRTRMTGSDLPSATYGTTQPLTKNDYGIQISSEENPKAAILEVRARRQQEEQIDINKNIGLVILSLIILIVIGTKFERILAYIKDCMPPLNDALFTISPVTTPCVNSVADELIKLRDLRDQGILTPKEFERQKNNLLS